MAEDGDDQAAGEILTLDADTEADALLEWIKDDIKTAPKQIFELGKFLFGVSSGAIGVLVSLSKFTGHAWAVPEWLSLAAFVLSGAVALQIAMPDVHELGGSFDLARAHGEMVESAKRRMTLWGFLAALGVLLAGIGLLG